MGKEKEQENRELRRRLEAAERRDWTSTTAIKALRRAADADRTWPALQQVRKLDSQRLHLFAELEKTRGALRQEREQRMQQVVAAAKARFAQGVAQSQAERTQSQLADALKQLTGLRQVARPPGAQTRTGEADTLSPQENTKDDSAVEQLLKRQVEELRNASLKLRYENDNEVQKRHGLEQALDTERSRNAAVRDELALAQKDVTRLEETLKEERARFEQRVRQLEEQLKSAEQAKESVQKERNEALRTIARGKTLLSRGQKAQRELES